MLFSLFIWEQEGKKENFNQTEVFNLIHSKRAALDMLGSCSQLYHYTHPPNCHTHYAPQFLAKSEHPDVRVVRFSWSQNHKKPMYVMEGRMFKNEQGLLNA